MVESFTIEKLGRPTAGVQCLSIEKPGKDKVLTEEDLYTVKKKSAEVVQLLLLVWSTVVCLMRNCSPSFAVVNVS